MKVYNYITVDIESGRTLEQSSYEYFGRVLRFCGATKEQKQAQTEESDIAASMTSDFNTIFKDNENILSSITGALSPVVTAGPNQTGFSPAEEAAQRTSASEEIAQAGRNAADSVRSATASRGGGNTYLPSGAEASIDASLAEQSAMKEAQAQNDITKQNYETGRENFFKAEGELAGAPGQLENPATAAGGAADSAAGKSMEGATEIAQADQAWMAPVGGLIGGIASAGLGRLGKKSG